MKTFRGYLFTNVSFVKYIITANLECFSLKNIYSLIPWHTAKNMLLICFSRNGNFLII